MTYMEEILKEKQDEYSSLIYLLDDFAHDFNLSIRSLAKFLLIHHFSKCIYVYVNINQIDYVQLSQEDSEKALNYLLTIFNDKKYNNSLSSRMSNDYIDELDHIHIKTDDLYNFPPLKELDFDYCVGYQILGTVSLKNVDYKELNKVRIAYFNAQPKIFSDEWYALHPKLQELRNMSIDEQNTTQFPHPSMDIENPNHAPELLLAVQAWEAKYIDNEYPHMEHTPAIKAFLTKAGYKGGRLQDRIAAITNPKEITKS